MTRQISLASVVAVVLWPLSLPRAADWPLWGGSPSRNNVVATRVPTDWNIGKFDRKTDAWDRREARNIKWVATLGSVSYGNPVVSGGRVFVGTNNGAGYLKRYPREIDVSCLLCFDEADGKFLWQYSAEKLATGRVHDWPNQGICSTPLVQGNRMWFVDNRGRVVCLDTEGFFDGEDDGEVVTERGRLFAIVPGVPDDDRSRYASGYLSDINAISNLFAAHGVKDTRCSWLKKDDQGNGWTVTSIEKNQKTLLRLEVEGFQVRVFRQDERDKPMFVAERESLRLLQGSRLPAPIRARLEKAGVVLPPDVVVKTVKPGTEWSIVGNYHGTQRTISLKLEGFWLTGSWDLTPHEKDEADVVWRLDMMNELGVSQHNMATCAPAAWGDTLFVCTSNGVDESHLNLPAPEAPSFIAVDKNTGKVLWQDKSPGTNVLHGQWSAPAIGVFDGVPQAIFPAGDGWVYSFRADAWNKKEGTPILLWKFDTNPKESTWSLGGRGTRNNVIAIPVIHDGLVYVSCGQDPEHGEGGGHLWCLDPRRRGDVSSQLAMQMVDGTPVPIPHRRIQAVVKEKGEIAVDNPNSAAVWHYDRFDHDGDGKIEFEEEFHRTLSSPVIKDDLLFIPDFSGMFHCFDAKTGNVHWKCDMLAACWGSPVIAGDKIYIGDEDGDVAVFHVSADPALSAKHTEFVRNGRMSSRLEPLHEILMNHSVYTTPIVANGVLYIADRSHLYAIQADSAP